MTCIFEVLLPCYCYATKARSRTIHSGVFQTVNLPLMQCEYRIRKQTVIAGINPTNQNRTADFTFSRNFGLLVPISSWANARFPPFPADAHGYSFCISLYFT